MLSVNKNLMEEKRLTEKEQPELLEFYKYDEGMLIDATIKCTCGTKIKQAIMDCAFDSHTIIKCPQCNKEIIGKFKLDIWLEFKE